MHSVLEVDSVLKSYGLRIILSNIYLKCETGEVVGLLGRNGCGKSTLLKIIYGIEQTESKSIRIDNTVYQNPYKTKNLIAYLPQHGFLPENIKLKKLINAYIRNSVKKEKILNDERIKKYLNTTINTLSSGELRYFEILLLVNLDAKFVLLDEPFSGIEPIFKENIKDLLANYSKEKGFIITDHDYRNILLASNRVILITGGTCKNIEKPGQLEDYHYLPKGTLQKKAETQVEKTIEPLKFEADVQTLLDLDIFDYNKGGSIFSIFNTVRTIGGRRIISEMLKNPVSDIRVLEDRISSIKFFLDENIKLEINNGAIDIIEHYITSDISFGRNNYLDALIQGINYKLNPKNDYYIKKTGIEKLIELLRYLIDFIERHQKINTPYCLANKFFWIQDILSEKGFREIIYSFGNMGLNAISIGKNDHFFRKKVKGKILQILDRLYELDAFKSIADAAIEYNLTFPLYSDLTDSGVQVEGLFHPLIKNPVCNEFTITKDKNLCLLTGANMSGKSTFLKSFGLAVYLAHVGFPVPAKKMGTTIFNGLITSINLSDNIFRGYSHFYSEVKRVKAAASLIKEKKRVMVIFDELFRGTNVKDAADASLMITSALSKIRNSHFLISTHIVEIAEELTKYDNIFYNCFESQLNGETPVYNYKLKAGISKERFGMQIVKNEKIVELLEEAINEEKFINP